MITPKELQELLLEFCIEPRADGFYYREDFEKAWKLMEEGYHGEELLKRLKH